MKKFLFMMASACLCGSLAAQTIDWSKSNSNVRTDSIAKKILEPARYLATYTYSYAKDASRPDDKKAGMAILQIGDRYNRFCDYYGLRFDSICDEVSRNKSSVMAASALMISVLRRRTFEESILIDKQENKETVQREVGAQKYQYEEGCPALEWEMLEGDTTIAGYRCGKAKAKLFGREYVAWYAPEVAMPYGPYKFNGLPGLVFQVADTQGNFEFALDGLQKAGGYVPIYLWSGKDMMKTSRETVRKIHKNYCADPITALGGSIQVSEEAKAKAHPIPYNPIELE